LERVVVVIVVVVEFVIAIGRKSGGGARRDEQTQRTIRRGRLRASSVSHYEWTASDRASRARTGPNDRTGSPCGGRESGECSARARPGPTRRELAHD